MSERQSIIGWLHSPAAYLTIIAAGIPTSQAPNACEALARALENGRPEAAICICVSDTGNPDCPRCGAQVKAAKPMEESFTAGCNACEGVRVMPRDASLHATLSDTVPVRHTCGKEEPNEVSHVRSRSARLRPR